MEDLEFEVKKAINAQVKQKAAKAQASILVMLEALMYPTLVNQDALMHVIEVFHLVPNSS